MRRALTAEQTRAFEHRIMDAHDLSLPALMDLVGAAVADRADSLAPTGRIIVMAGKGNNAGDGWVAGRLLHERGREVRVLTLVDPDGLPEVACEAALRAGDVGMSWTLVDPTFDLASGLDGAALVVDAIFGFGVLGAVREPFASAIETLDDTDVPVLSVDLPSGVESDTGLVHGAAVTADHTLVVLSLKVGHVQEPGASLAGRVDVTDLGLTGLSPVAGDGVEVWDADDVAAVLPTLDPLDHKGSRGSVLLVGGSAGMTGSISLAAWGALRSGAGYVTVAVPASLTDVIDREVIPAVVVALPEDEDRALGEAAADVALAHAERADALVVGPGIGGTDLARDTARRLISESTLPLVADADALNALVDHGGLLRGRVAPTVITPHPGEAGRLLGMTAAAVQDDRLACAARLASDSVVSVLKGAYTIVSEEGRQAVVTTGNPGMATMGTGDVLAGVIGALLAQGVVPFDAAVAGSYLHGLAGDLAAAELTRTSLTATDIPERLPAAFGEVLAVRD